MCSHKRRFHLLVTAFSMVLGSASLAHSQSIKSTGNRLAYLDESDPYYVHRGFPKLTTPQWVGEPGIEAVVVLAIDDMTNNSAKYEAYLRPILNRLKQIDGRAAVSIMTCRADPLDPLIQTWLKEGVAIDVHTIGHPCPLLGKGIFSAAERSVHDCVDLLNKIPANRPVAFRMPCCDSLNTPSPRFFAEIFNKPTKSGNFLAIDSSVFNITTPNDPELARELVLEPNGGDRFRKYIPFHSFVNTIEDYPYPYIIGKLCWEFPCIVPSDWEANHLHKPNNPKTLEDMKAALDAVVAKRGVMNLVFHPHGWIQNNQIVDLIDYAATKYGKKVKFLNFRQALDRINTHLLDSQPIRNPKGSDNGVRLVDINNDGYLDVLIGNSEKQTIKIWDSKSNQYRSVALNARFVDPTPAEGTVDSGFRLGSAWKDRRVLAIKRDETKAASFVLKANGETTGASLSGLEIDGQPVLTIKEGRDQGVRLRDLDGDGTSELIVANPRQSAVFAQTGGDPAWKKLAIPLPKGAFIVDDHGRDAGLRFVDVDEDGYDDLLFSNDNRYGLFLFESIEKGWTRSVLSGTAADPKAIPKIVHDGMNNGAWVHSRQLWVQNENTDKLPDLVDRRSFNELLKNEDPKGKSAEASLRAIRVRPGFEVEIAAAEPLVNDPIAFDWGADGSLWVVEMGDYPLGLDGKGKPGGQVRKLIDVNHDGTYDKMTIFLDGLGFPTGVLPWKQGVLVSCAPEIFYAEDRDGDGKADFRETLFTGFVEGNQQHRVNGFELGLDGWVHGANGDSGGLIVSKQTGKRVSIGGRDFRFDPETGGFETETGASQYGRHRNDWGNWFSNNNPTWLWHNVLSERELVRNPSFALANTRQLIDTNTRIYPISRTLPRFNNPDSANRVTSANSPMPYRDDLFGPGFESSVFVSEPVHNVVHRIRLEPAGGTFIGGRPADEQDREFLASSDNWFRPTMLKTGPDGALWIADMDRAVIEHPEWIPDDWEAKIDLRAGADIGRIFRVKPVGKTPRPIVPLDQLDTPALVTALESSSGWTRDTAMRLLMHKNDAKAIGLLRDLIAKSRRPKTIVQALHTLTILGGIDSKSVAIAIASADPRVRRHGVQTSETLLAKDPNLASQVARLAADPNAGVRFQTALTMGDWDDPKAAEALALILARDGADPWTRAAVFTSAKINSGMIIEFLLKARQGAIPPPEVINPLLAITLASPDRSGLATLIEAITKPTRASSERFATTAALLEAIDRAGLDVKALAKRDPELARALAKIDSIVADANQALAADSPDEVRIRALGLLGRRATRGATNREQIARLIHPRSSIEVQREAVAALERSGGDDVPRLLVADWKTHAPSIRTAILDLLMSHPSWTPQLFAAIDSGTIRAGEIDSPRRRILLAHRDRTIRDSAQRVLGAVPAGRSEVLAKYAPALDLPGNNAKGALVFKKACAACHALGGVGVAVGPDLATLNDRSPQSLLTAILDPNRAFESKFAAYSVSTKDGRILTGLIANETATSILLRKQDAKDDLLLRTEIDEIAGTGQSLMPEGLEKDLSPADLADLITYLAGTARPTTKTGPVKETSNSQECSCLPM